MMHVRLHEVTPDYELLAMDMHSRSRHGQVDPALLGYLLARLFRLFRLYTTTRK